MILFKNREMELSKDDAFKLALELLKAVNKLNEDGFVTYEAIKRSVVEPPDNKDEADGHINKFTFYITKE